jgi:3-hydroxybutyryl-CoA dehydrogenase
LARDHEKAEKELVIVSTISEIQSVAVLGLGTMGHGIAQTFAMAGYTVFAFDEVSAARDSVKKRIRENLDAFVRAGLISADRIEPTIERVQVCTGIDEAVRDANFVTEAIAEDLIAKQSLFAELEMMVRPGTILASNSSSFFISQSASAMGNSSHAIVTHWFNPPHLVPLVEVVPSPATREDVVTTTMQLMTAIGKKPLRLRKELPGFLVNRIQVALMREIWDLYEQGVASAEEIDAALRGSVGFRLAAVGPLEVHDFGGLDIQATVFRTLAPEIRNGSELPLVVKRLVDEGHLGAKTGRGFYTYTPEQVDDRRNRRDSLFLELVKLLHPETIPLSTQDAFDPRIEIH